MYDLVVIGGGSGGLRVASAAAEVGASVALIEKRKPGGKSGFTGGVPSKALVQAARTFRQVRDAGSFGIQTGSTQIDFPAVMNRVRSVVEEVAADGSLEAMQAQGIEVFHGVAVFDAYDTVRLEDGTRIEGHRFVIATGSRPALPAVDGLDQAGALDNASIWSLSHVPESLVVIGAGPVGLEFALAFARFGSKVTVLADSEAALPLEDSEVSAFVESHLSREGIVLKTGVSLEQVETRGGHKLVHFKDRSTGTSEVVSGSELLVAAGRLANIESLNLEAVGVHADPTHGIEVDELLQTQAPRIFAIGDVLLRHQYTHTAVREAEIAFQNAVLRRRKKMDYSTIPWATFLDPEVASVGINENQAKSQGRDHRIFRTSYSDIDRARIDGRTEGFAKVVATPSGKILGASVVGEDASLVLQELVLAMESDLGLAAVASAVHTYPTYAGVISHLARQYQATRLSRGYVQTALKFFYGFQPRTVVATSDAQDSTNGSHSHEPSATTEHEHGH